MFDVAAHAQRAAGLCTSPGSTQVVSGRTPRRPRSGASQTKQVVHIDDLTSDSAYLEGDPAVARRWSISAARAPSSIVPMLKDDELIGAIGIYRQEVRPFTDKQIELVDELRRPGRHRHREHAPA